MTTHIAKGFAPTDEQKEIISAAASPKGSAMVEAGAGCAKSTTMELAAQGIRVPGLALTFGKRDSERMAKSLPGNFVAKSFNGLGHQAWARALPQGASLKLDDRKVGRLLTSVAKEWAFELDESDWSDARRMVAFAQIGGLVPRNDPFGAASLISDSPEGWQEVGEAAGVLAKDVTNLWELARETLLRSIEEARRGIISFDDQIYCSTMLGGKFPEFPVIIADEDQDLSALNIKMLGAALRPGGRIFAVGDKRQAIYAFRGAHGNAAAQIRQILPEAQWQDFPLMTTFRCPKLVVARQHEHVPGFRAAPGNRQGKIITLGDSPEVAEGADEANWTWEDVLVAHGDNQGQIAILCRNNGPLLALAFRLLRRGIPVMMLGRDIGTGLLALAKKICPDAERPIGDFLVMVREWQAKEIGLAKEAERDDKIAGISDRAECLIAVGEAEGIVRVGDLVKAITKLFSATSGRVVLSSIHRSKGQEWDTVLVLDPWRIPSRFAKESAKQGNLVPLEQEKNLRYVAETRTKQTLLFGNLEVFS